MLTETNVRRVLVAIIAVLAVLVLLQAYRTETDGVETVRLLTVCSSGGYVYVSDLNAGWIAQVISDDATDNPELHWARCTPDK